jgi:hypothetical protein
MRWVHWRTKTSPGDDQKWLEIKAVVRKYQLIVSGTSR